MQTQPRKMKNGDRTSQTNSQKQTTSSTVATYLAEDQDTDVAVSSRVDNVEPVNTDDPAGRPAVPRFSPYVLWIGVAVAVILLIIAVSSLF